MNYKTRFAANDGQIRTESGIVKWLRLPRLRN